MALKSGTPFDYYKGDNFNKFKAEIKIPIAGQFSYTVSQCNGGGGSANLWSSSSDIHMRARQLILTTTIAEVSANARNNRAYGNSVRCFMNDYVAPSYTLIFLNGDIEVWSGTAISGSTYT